MRRAYALALVVVVALSIAFYWGDFTFASSKTTSSVKFGSDVSTNATVNSGFCVYPDSPFGKMVAEELRNRGYKVLLLGAPVECDGQFLAVWVEWINASYTPLYAEGSIRVGAIYSSAGDPSHYLGYRNATDKEAALVNFEKTSTPQIRGYLRITVSDSSKGIIGFRGYAKHLMRSAAKSIASSVLRFPSGEEG
ncbi:hypothetical protein [Thermococcus pacificus]|uniref:Uncharacterized protein n=1 Tax=Thermococcus pacificus TaxID=71998 RepID=A0A218P851_9EURY|nr:hypothetical protein [Thermococcus pacificus]ASJ06951.1 hypothetical protein A3L08_06250 [Thermococcus pacificus]